MTYQILETYPVNIKTSPSQPGHRNKGFPAGGPADQPLAQTALALASPQAELYELSAQFRIQATSPTLVGITSRLEEFTLNNQPHKGCERLVLQPHDQLAIPAPKRSARLYVAITPCNGNHKSFRLAELFDQDRTHLHWIPDSNSEHQNFLAQVTEASLIGVRLEAGLPGKPSLPLSEPSVPGVIQVTPDGTLLIHGIQGPTIGGYHRAGAVIAADIWKLGQYRHGDTPRLTPVTPKEAKNLLQTHLNHTQNTLQTIQKTIFLLDQNPQ